MAHVLLIEFANESDAYEGFAKIKDIQLDQSYVEEAALVQEDEGRLDIKETYKLDEDAVAGTLTGGLIGALFGLFTGGLGWLLWGSVGVLVGAIVDDHDDNKEDALLTDMSKKMHNSHLFIIAVADEANEDIINHAVDHLDAVITRYNLDDIKEEIKEAKELNREVAREAHKKLVEKKREAREKKRQEREEKKEEREEKREEKKEAKEDAQNNDK